MIIVGAGLTGLIAAHKFPEATIVERAAGPEVNHAAVLRFRSPRVGELVGYELDRVRVRKGIWMEKRFHEPNIRLANLYSKKVTGSYVDRSIWDIAPADRWVARPGFVELLHVRLRNRINYGVLFDAAQEREEPAIITAPMNTTVRVLASIDPEDMRWRDTPHFAYSNVSVHRFVIHNANLYQTIYFPSPVMNVYRASMTGDMLIVESMSDDVRDDLAYVFNAFGIDSFDEKLPPRRQSYGKILEIDDGWRKAAIYDMTVQHNLYSLGRFATWRNILLDDVVDDCDVVRKLMEAGSYNRARMFAR